MSTDFKNSQEAAFRRIVRSAVRKGPFTKSERDVTLVLVNHWFHHKAKGRIHPGRAKIAKASKVTEKTVSRTFGKLRAAGVMNALSPLKGNRHKATEYEIDVTALLVLCGCDWVDTIRRNVPSKFAEMSHLGRDKMSHRNKNVSPSLSQARDGGSNV